MQIVTSYFYQIRFFTPNIIPISTALWDPKWYHNNQGPKTKFIDKRGVINGLRAEFLKPKQKDYYEQLLSLNREQVLYDLQRCANAVQKRLGFKEEPVIALMVYEAPNNPISERADLQRYFNCEEWKK